MKTNLDQAIGWKGKVYEGDCEIPDDLAIALGLTSSNIEPDAEAEEGEDKPTARRRKT